MSADALTGIVHRLGRQAGGPPDGELLGRFARDRDEAAFATLVHRHGRLVLGVARRHLSDRHAAEDVVQATFLALARAAAKLAGSPSLVNWLYTVAVRQSRLTRRRVSLGSARLHRLPPPSPAPDPLTELTGRELLTIIDDELARLPLLLCAVEGLSREEAAHRLGWPLGSVKGRLERGRELLRKRLAKRGLTVPAVLTGGLLASPAEALPPALMQSVVKAALTVPPAALPVKLFAMIAVVLMAVGVGAGTALLPSGRSDTPPSPPAVAAVAPPAADPLPDGALRRFGSGRFRHGEAIYGSALSPDGKRLATHSAGSVAVWDLATGRVIRRFHFDGPYGECVPAFSPDGTRLAVVRSKCARVWDLPTGDEVWRRETDMFADDRFTSHRCWFSADGRELLLMEGERMVFRAIPSGVITRASPGKLLVRLVSADLKTFVRVDGRNGTVVVGDVATGAERLALDAALARANERGLALSPSGTALAVVHQNKEIQVRDLPSGAVRVSFPLPETAKYRPEPRDPDYWEYRLNFSPDGRVLFLGTVGGTVHRWDLATKAELPPLKKLPGPRPDASLLTGCHVLPDGRTLVTAGRDGLIRLWDLTTGRERSEPEAYVGRVRAALSPDGRLVAAADEQGRVDLWDAATGTLARTIRRSGPAVSNLAFSPDGRMLAAGQHPRAVQLWDVATGRETKAFQSDGGKVLPAFTLLFSPDGRSLYVSDYPHRSRLWDVVSGVQRWVASHDYGAAYTPDGATVIAARCGPVLGYLDATAGADRRTIRLDSKQPDGLGEWRPVAVSGDGRWLAVPDIGRTIVMCDVATGVEVRRWQAVEPLRGLSEMERRFLESDILVQVSALAFSPDSLLIAAASKHGAVGVRDVFTGREVLRFEGHEQDVRNLGFGPDGRTLLSAGVDGQMFLWSLRPKPGPAAPPAALWDALAADDVAAAYRAVWALSADPQAMARLREKLPPVPPPDPDRLAKLVADLDDSQFRVRAAAARELAGLGREAGPPLEEALRKGLSPEAGRRVQEVLDGLKRAPTPAEVRQLRAVRALELAATPAAREHLKALAAGAPGATLTRAAADAVKRLGP
jgi:RNA polymerase sigma factor (sigma-70 family)